MKSTISIFPAVCLALASIGTTGLAAFECSDFATASLSLVKENDANNCGIGFISPPIPAAFLKQCNENGLDWAKRNLAANNAGLDKCIHNRRVSLELSLGEIQIQGDVRQENGNPALSDVSLGVHYSIANRGANVFEVDFSPGHKTTDKRNFLVTINGHLIPAEPGDPVSDNDLVFTAEDHVHNIFPHSATPGRSEPGHVAINPFEQAYGQIRINNPVTFTRDRSALDVSGLIVFNRGDGCYSLASSNRRYDCEWKDLPGGTFRRGICSPRATGQDTSHFDYSNRLGNQTAENGCTQFMERLR